MVMGTGTPFMIRNNDNGHDMHVSGTASLDWMHGGFSGGSEMALRRPLPGLNGAYIVPLIWVESPPKRLGDRIPK